MGVVLSPNHHRQRRKYGWLAWVRAYSAGDVSCVVGWCGVAQLAALERSAVWLRVPGWRTLAEYSEAVDAGYCWSRREVATARS